MGVRKKKGCRQNISIINGIIPLFLVIILNVWIVVELQKLLGPLLPKSSRKRKY